MHKLKSIKFLKGYKIDLHFDDGTQGVVDLSHLKGKGVFKAWNSDIKFEDAYIDNGVLAWSNDLDICPDSLYYKVKDINPEAYFFSKAS